MDYRAYCLTDNIFCQQSGQTETRNSAADNEDSFTKQQFDIIQQIMNHTQQQIASSSVSKNSSPKNSNGAKTWNNQQVINTSLITLL